MEEEKAEEAEEEKEVEAEEEEKEWNGATMPFPGEACFSSRSAFQSKKAIAPILINGRKEI